MKTGITFHMDGTLWDSASQVAAAWSRITVPKLGKKVTAQDMYRTMGMPMDQLAAAIFPGHALSELLPILEESYQLENDYLIEHGAVLYPDLIKTIQELSRTYPLYIVSNCQEGYIEAFLTYYQLGPYFEDHICFGENNKSKGENIALIMERNQIERGIYVGDIQADYEAAMAGGAEFIHAAYGFGTVEAEVPRLHAFRELPELLKSSYCSFPS